MDQSFKIDENEERIGEKKQDFLFGSATKKNTLNLGLEAEFGSPSTSLSCIMSTFLPLALISAEDIALISAEDKLGCFFKVHT